MAETLIKVEGKTRWSFLHDTKAMFPVTDLGLCLSHRFSLFRLFDDRPLNQSTVIFCICASR